MQTAIENRHDFTKGATLNGYVAARHANPLDLNDVRKTAPSVFAESAHPKNSKRYQFVRTIDVIQPLLDAGYAITRAQQSVARDEGGGEYVKHMLRLTQARRDSDLRVGDVFPEIVLTNSHNRTSSFLMEAGLYRYICSNGAMACAADFAGVRVLHNDPQIHKHVAEGAKAVQGFIDNVATPMVEKMTKITIPQPLQVEFAKAATYLKFGEERPDHAEHFLAVRRKEDEGDDLWHVLNRVQENAVRGGYAVKDKGGRTITQRGIQSVDRDREFNTNLWLLGARVAEMAQ